MKREPHRPNAIGPPKRYSSIFLMAMYH
ncbi:hypothetical protein DPX39_070056900 [Trypanosoma brucei equiperdum]|uniref:Uncharacterized protein n=1 Tax=Trypanosoma brucei equiperdum TaxID=630700 RepID=A0A3L6L417_9TRYP|nr:hypothetical protein DPX39_070056900 [Trypanosoma brucei equiperdum]